MLFIQRNTVLKTWSVTFVTYEPKTLNLHCFNCITMHATHPAPELLQSKQHFLVLDGLRGIAAIGVLIFHFMEIALPDFEKNFIAHGYLAVDFFFCLSGFVIAYAYDNRLKKIGAWTFFKLRLIRLQPLVVIGSVIGLLSFLFDPFSNLQESYTGFKTFLMFICSCLMIPFPAVPERFNNFFHLNAPTWSLFWEYISNIFYAFLFIKLRNKLLWVLTIFAALLLGYESYKSGHLSVGWGSDNFWGGGIRVLYSFLSGMLIYRLKWVIRSNMGFGMIGFLLFLAFLVPFREAANWWVDPLVIILYFPFLIALGAGAKNTAGSNRICRFLGEISYPLYMVHYPFIWIFFSYVQKFQPGITEMSTLSAIGSILLIGFAYLIMKYLDAPLRAYFKKKMR